MWNILSRSCFTLNSVPVLGWKQPEPCPRATVIGCQGLSVFCFCPNSAQLLVLLDLFPFWSRASSLDILHGTVSWLVIQKVWPGIEDFGGWPITVLLGSQLPHWCTLIFQPVHAAAMSSLWWNVSPLAGTTQGPLCPCWYFGSFTL